MAGYGCTPCGVESDAGRRLPRGAWRSAAKLVGAIQKHDCAERHLPVLGDLSIIRTITRNERSLNAGPNTLTMNSFAVFQTASHRDISITEVCIGGFVNRSEFNTAASVMSGSFTGPESHVGNLRVGGCMRMAACSEPWGCGPPYPGHHVTPVRTCPLRCMKRIKACVPAKVSRRYQANPVPLVASIVAVHDEQ